MVKLCIKLYAGGITTADNVATVVVPVNSTLIEVSVSTLTINAGAVGNAMQFQLSQMGTSSWLSNDVRGIVAEWIAGNDKAINFNGVNNIVIPIGGIKFAAGDVLRLHRNALTAASLCNCNVNLQMV